MQRNFSFEVSTGWGQVKAKWSVEQIPPMEPRELIEMFWTTLREEVWQTGTPRLTAICLQSVNACLETQSSVEALLNSKVRKAVSIVRGNPDLGFRYEDAQDGRQSTYFFMSFYGRSSTTTNAGPVLLSMLWSENAQKWVPTRLMTDESLDLTLPF